MKELTELTISEVRKGLRGREFTSVEVTKDCLDSIIVSDQLNAFSTVTADIALEQAKKSDKRLFVGDAPSMCGVPIGVKDLFCTKGVKTQAAVSYTHLTLPTIYSV